MENRSGPALAAAVAERLRVTDAAMYLGLSVSTLDTMRSKGRGPRYLRIGGRVYYRRGDLDQYIEAGVVETSDSRARA